MQSKYIVMIPHKHLRDNIYSVLPHAMNITGLATQVTALMNHVSTCVLLVSVYTRFSNDRPILGVTVCISPSQILSSIVVHL